MAGSETSKIRKRGKIEHYSPRRRAELILSNATDAEDYKRALEVVREMGLDPAKIRHRKQSFPRR